MLRNDLYYLTKPFLPWRLRMSLRRMAGRRIRRENQATWPIDEGAVRLPTNWPGWPDGRKFAVVLTHDVEGPDGLEKCRRLADIEAELGFRSAFNFIPEGGYTVPPDLRDSFVRDGFEIGIHDLFHDGKLFDSPDGFAWKAKRINYYLREWNAVGFRAGFMMRNLEWYHQLDAQYDSSTFDSDPFEPQPDGVRTLFPFWIPRAGIASATHNGGDESERGYAELPYTLPQDSTVFFVLGETTPAIWLQKADWVAAHGGMVLVNVHPDYVCFEGERASAKTYPVSHYADLLRHIRSRYAGEYWQALPRQVAAHVRQANPRPTLHLPKRIAMITHSFYETDNRVTRYAESLAERGDRVDVFALRSGPSVPRTECLNGVNVFRIQNRFGKAQRSQLAYAWPLIRFLFTSMAKLTRRHIRDDYALVHVHNMPDFLVYAAAFPRWTGARIILDIHDIVPEFYGNKFAAGHSRMRMATLKWIERRSARFAHHIIISNDLWLPKFAGRTGTGDRCSVFINNVDTDVFRPDLRTRHDDKLIIMFPGGLQWHQGVDIALAAFARIRQDIPNAEFHIYGDGIMKPGLVILARELGLNGSVKFFEPVRIKQIAQVMANADLGVVPKRADSFGNEAYSTKIMEFMSLGVPVVVSSTKIDRYYFPDSVVRFFESGNAEALAEAMRDVLCHSERKARFTANALEYAHRHSWESRKPDYLGLVDSLTH